MRNIARKDAPAPGDFVGAVKDMIRKVPRGRVATYGQIAALCGRPRSARQVGRVLRDAGPNAKLPWHRILNGQGRISLGEGRAGDEQRKRLEAEGVRFTAAGRVDLREYGWRHVG